MIVLLKVLAVLALVFMNGFFVASEFAIVKMRETRLVELAELGNIRAKVARGLVKQLDAYLSATQLGITIASLGLGWVGEPLVSHQLEPLLGYIGIENPAAVTSVSVITGFIIISFLHIVLGELAPKSLAIRRTEETSLWVSIPLRLFYWTFFPAIWVLNGAAIGVLRLFGLQPATDEELVHSEAELMMILSESARGGHISEQEKMISGRALRLADMKAMEVMVPRNEVVYFTLDEPLEDQLDKARRHNFARFPLCETDLDSMVGMVHIRDLFWAMRETGKPDLRSVSREIPVVSEGESLEKVLHRLREAHIHMALVVDERGVVSGVVTLEDIIEQLVGQIQDEFDRETPWLKKVDEDTYDATGRVPLASLSDKLAIQFENQNIVTLSGYITEKLGRFPREGDLVMIGDWKITVKKMDALKIRTCRIEKIPSTEEAGPRE